MPTRTFVAILLGGLMLAAEPQPASAQDMELLGGGELELTFPEDGGRQELSLYLELEREGFYGGALGLASSDSADNEIDLYLGYRGETEGGFTYDLNYTRYFFPNDGGNCCGDVIFEVGQTIGEAFEITGEVKFDPETSDHSETIGVGYALADDLELSANFGLVHEDGAGDAREWDVGFTYDLSDEAALDLRYYDGSDFSGYLGLSLRFDTTILGAGS
jgi:uncharacterized protein (TIGR02001 family)